MTRQTCDGQTASVLLALPLILFQSAEPSSDMPAQVPMRSKLLLCLLTFEPLFKGADSFIVAEKHLSAPLPHCDRNTVPTLFATPRTAPSNNPSPRKRRQKRNKPNRRNLRVVTPPTAVPKVNEQQQPTSDQQDDDPSARYTASINCPHFQTCSGCSKESHVTNVPVVESARRFFASPSVQQHYPNPTEQAFSVVVPSPLRQWRSQAKLVATTVQGGGDGGKWSSQTSSTAGCQFGLYQRGSHVVERLTDCAVHHAAINRALTRLTAATRRAGTIPFHEASREGQLRYVQLQVEESSGRVALTLVWNAATLKETQPGLARLVKELKKEQSEEEWHSIWCHCNDGTGNAIFARSPKRWHRLYGAEFIREELSQDGTSSLYFSPLTFRQGNMQGFRTLANDVARLIPGHSKVCELYGGVGVLGLTALVYLYEKGEPLEWLHCSDENPANPRCFDRSVKSLPSAATGLGLKGNFQKRHGASDDNDDGLTMVELATMMESGIEQPPRPSGKQEKRVTYTVAAASKALRNGQGLGANVLIVDPPRKGLEVQVVEEICKPRNDFQATDDNPTWLNIPDERVNWVNDVNMLVYVSCGFEAFTKDCERILSSRGGWQLKSNKGYVLFPGSDHLETVAVFTR